MILGSLESQRRALQDHGEKHHSPSCEKEAIKKEFDFSQKIQTGKTSNTKNATRYLYEIRFNELELGMEMNTSSQFSHG